MGLPGHEGRTGSRWLSVALAREPSASADRREACLTAGEANEAVQRRLPARDDPTAAAYRACGTVASDGDRLLLDAEVSRNLTQAFMMPSDAGHETRGQARRAPAGGRADFETRRTQALRSAEMVDHRAPLRAKRQRSTPSSTSDSWRPNTWFGGSAPSPPPRPPTMTTTSSPCARTPTSICTSCTASRSRRAGRGRRRRRSRTSCCAASPRRGCGG